MAVRREKVIRTAEKLVARGKLEAAIKEYRKVLAENPNDANTLNRVGDLYARIERFDEAVKLFSQIADQYSNDGFFVKAIAIYKKIIKLSPQSLQVYERLAELYYKQGLLNEARSQFQILADHYEKRDNATSAINIYQRMSEIDPDNPSHYLKLAKLFEGQQLTDKALRSYRQLADLFLVNGSIDEATQVYLSALDAHHGELGFVREVIQGLHDEGHTQAAEKVLAKAGALNPGAIAVGREIFATPASKAAAPAEGAGGRPAAAEPEAAQAESWTPPSPSLPGDEDVSFDLDSFELPDATPAAFPEPAPDPSSIGLQAASEQGEEEDEDSVFTLDLDNDAPTPTQVMPPPDMLEQAPESDEFDIEIEGGVGEPFASLEDAIEAVGDQEAPEELDWSIDEPPVGGAEEELADLGGDEFEIDIEAPAFEVEEALGEAAPGEEALGEAALGEAAPGEVEAAAGEAEAAPPDAAHPETMARHEDDLLAEAKVFAKYGLHDKAGDRLEELLGIQPEHLDGLTLLTRVELDAGRHEAAATRAREVARIAAVTGRTATWSELLRAFAKAGHPLDESEFDVAPQAVDGDRFAQLLEDLDETSAGLTVPAYETPVVLEPEAPEPGSASGAAAELGGGELTLDLDFEDQLFEEGPVEATPPEPVPARESASEPFAEIEALMKSVTRDAGFEEFVPEETSLEDLVPLDELTAEDGASPEAVEEAPAAAAPSGGRTAERGANHLVSLVDELDLGDLDDLDVAAPAGAAPVAPSEAGREGDGARAGATASELDETGMSWLDEIAPPPAEAEAESESIFDEEDDFFDLAAELEAEMVGSDDRGLDLETPHEQSLEEIIDGFKRGVAENLSSEDYDTHYNLGIAYREMGLLDEAIGEFQLASKDPRYMVDCSSMLGICFLDKGLPELAVRWYKKGLESPALNEEQALGLLYDLGSAYVTTGDAESAYRTFVEIYGMNSNYRDVAQRIQELQQAVPSS